MIDPSHRHNYEVQGEFLVCSCGKKKLNLKRTGVDNILSGKKSNGAEYSVRNDRHRYFFPGEWRKFIACIKDDQHHMFFLTALNTGGRVMEILHLKVKNFDFERSTITFEVVKERAAKKNFKFMSKKRTFFVSDKYMKELKAYLRQTKLGPNDYLFLDNNDIPANYDQLNNREKKVYYQSAKTSYSQLFKRKLKEAGIKDWRNFSLHNIRKTYGNWMRIFEIKTEEICYRLGHDMATYFMYYGSPLIFTQQEKIDIISILGQVK